MLLETLLRWLVRRPKSKFKVGDFVKLRGGVGRRMQVIEIAFSSDVNDPIIVCRWEDPASGEIVTNLYRESKLENFESSGGH